MIVPCPNCHTNFNLDDKLIPSDGAWVRCSKCQETFQIMPETGQQPAGQTRPAPLPEESPDDSLHVELSDSPAQEADFGLETPERPFAASNSKPGIVKLAFWAIAGIIILLLVGSGGLVALERLGIAPGLVSVFSDAPLLGSLLHPDSTQPGQPAPPDNQGLILGQVRGYFRGNQVVGRIFVIQGLVENQLSKARTGILVRGRLNDIQGNPARQAVVYAGPVFTPEELRQLSLQDIQARLGQPTGPDGDRYVLAPNGTIPFMIIFANLPDNLSEFTAEVVGSEYLAN